MRGWYYERQWDQREPSSDEDPNGCVAPAAVIILIPSLIVGLVYGTKAGVVFGCLEFIVLAILAIIAMVRLGDGPGSVR